MDIELKEIFIIILCIIVTLFCIYLVYVCYLKKFKSYRYHNGIPDVAILRPSRIGSAGFKGFSAASFRSSQISMSSTDRGKLCDFPKRPHTFPLISPQQQTTPSALSILPEIRVHHV